MREKTIPIHSQPYYSWVFSLESTLACELIFLISFWLEVNVSIYPDYGEYKSLIFSA